MRNYRNPTENRAAGAIDREIRQLEKLARRIKDGKLSPEQEDKALRRFTGIYRGVLVRVWNESSEKDTAPEEISQGLHESREASSNKEYWYY